MSSRLAIVVSHPIQYYSPWFRNLAGRAELDLKVFYLWDFGITEKRDPVFGTSFKWDVPLMDGYESTFVTNVSKDPGTHHFHGLDNPGLVEAISEWNPDAILLIGYNYKSLLQLIFSPRLRKIPILFRGDSHELSPALGWKSKVSRFLRGLIFRRFVRVLAVGTASLEYFQGSGVPRRKIRIVPHCIDNERFRSSATKAREEAQSWKRELGIPEDATVVLFAGKLENKKRPQDLMEAYLQVISRKSKVESLGDVSSVTLTRQSSDSVLLFVGSGPLEGQLKAMAGEHLGRDIFFAPFQNQSAMPRVYAMGDLLVLPSQGRGETWGLAVNEAMNLGLPAIVSSHVGCGPDLIREGKTGWIFQAGDRADLTRCLSEALSDPKQLRVMGDAARDLISGFSFEAASQGVVDAVGEGRKD
jgi:glycosyltransferase involved in cell wall biosynthesis